MEMYSLRTIIYFATLLKTYSGVTSLLTATSRRSLSGRTWSEASNLVSAVDIEVGRYLVDLSTHKAFTRSTA